MPLTLKATRAGYGALGIGKPRSQPKRDGTTEAPRTDTKQALLIGMLQRPEGATVTELVAAMNSQPHTVRGAIAGALKKKLRLTSRPKRRRAAGGCIGSM